MKEPGTVTLSTEEMILELVRSLDEKVDELSEGQADIKAQIATHEERSLNQGKRIERVEKITVDLSAAFTSADDTVLQIIYDGTSWYEVSRSVN